MAEEAATIESAAGAEEGAATQVEAPAATEGGQEKMLPQSEVDRIVQERLARAGKNQPSKDELAELRAAKTKLEEIEQAGQSELEKANAAREKAEAAAKAALETANGRLVTAEAKAALAAAGVTNIEGALRALDKTGLTVEDDGTVSGAEEAVKNLLESIPEFVGKVVPPKVDQGARGTTVKDGQVTEAQLETMSHEEIARATRQGRMKDLLG
jgi:DNA repair exonuclease SbcCD ATPase subunit